MKILFVMDPLEKCDLLWDNSLRLLWELSRRGHQNWTADACDLYAEGQKVYARAGLLIPHAFTHRGKLRFRYEREKFKTFDLRQFDLILIRKDPPFDENYLSMTYLLERAADQVPMVNHPRGIRNQNEKLSTLNFPRWIPKTCVSSCVDTLLSFQKKLRKAVVVKPLNLRSGKGVFRLAFGDPDAAARLKRATQGGAKTVVVQEFIQSKSGEKRIVLLNGELLAVYEKRARKNDFRANLSLGATFHRSKISRKEKKLIAELKPFLIREGLYFVGLDVLGGKLIEINVTSPAGVTEATFLEPRLRPVEAWADFLEDFSSRFFRRP